MTLDQDLMEIEPILRGTDGTFQFTHPSFQEVLTDNQFADEINSGKLSVRDAWVHFFSYEEDVELWELPKDREWRALLPDWTRIINIVISLLPYSESEFQSVLQNSYELTKDKFDGNYNPFEYDCRIIGAKHYELPNLPSRELEETNRGENPDSLIAIVEKRTDLDFSKMSKAAAARTLGKMRCKEAIPALCDLMLSIYHPLNYDGYHAAEALGEIGSEEAVEPLIAHLSNKNNIWRFAAAYPLGEIGSKKAVRPLIDYLSDHSNPHREFAADALGMLGSREAVEVLTNFLLESSEMSFHGAWALCSIGDDNHIEPVIEYISNPQNTMGRQDIKEGLSGFKSYRVLTSLVKRQRSVPINEKEYFSGIIAAIHKRLKPQGYNPAVKRLVA